MSKKDKQATQANIDNTGQPVKISCEVCLKEVPVSVAHSLEGGEYVMNFCGIECNDKWIQQGEVAKDKNYDSNKH